ncbi:oxidoreductase [Stipitochalara longipes BDJ]|nr:oxidoreductase [Stipitochalara longipes BDJ]
MALRSVLITGCSQGGAGEALARVFHQNGFRVFATARSLDTIQHLKVDGIEILQLDVLEAQSIDNTAATISSITGGTLDILINNAGAGYIAPMLDVDFSKASKIFDLNVFAPFALVNSFIPLLIAGKGTVVNIGSYADALPIPWQGIYNASKAALRSLTDNLRLELRPFNVNVVYIAAGGIRSKFLENLGTVYVSKTSLYYPAREILEPIMNYEDGETYRTQMPPTEFAQEVYEAVLAGGSLHRVYAGTQTPLSNIPAAERDEMLASATGIAAAAELIQRVVAWASLI